MPRETRKPFQETSDVQLPLLGYLLAGFAALIVVVPLSLWLFYPNSRERHDVALPALQSSQPKLETDPPADLREYLRAQEGRLSRSGVNPGNPNTFQIPINRAMDLIAGRGLEGWRKP
jgi:hypothetical protein